MIKRNDPKVILEGLQNRARRAVSQTKLDKWLEINDHSWELVKQIFKQQMEQAR